MNVQKYLFASLLSLLCSTIPLSVGAIETHDNSTHVPYNNMHHEGVEDYLHDLRKYIQGGCTDYNTAEEDLFNRNYGRYSQFNADSDVTDYALDILSKNTNTKCQPWLEEIVRDAVNVDWIKRDPVRWQKVGERLIRLLNAEVTETKGKYQGDGQYYTAAALAKMDGHFKEVAVAYFREYLKHDPPQEAPEKEMNWKKLQKVFYASQTGLEELDEPIKEAVKRDQLIPFLEDYIRKYSSDPNHDKARLQGHKNELKTLKKMVNKK